MKELKGGDKPTQNRAKNTREKILNEALKLFADKGFHCTSTREVAEKSKVNLSAIKYYFGDKNGLYRAAYFEPIGTFKDKINLFPNKQELDKSLSGIFRGMFDLLKSSVDVKLCLKLHMREMVDPTFIKEESFNNEILPYHKALLYVIKKEVPNIEEKDANRLIFSIRGMVFFVFSHSEEINKISPGLISTDIGLDEWRDKVIGYAISIINSEKVLYDNKV